MRARESESLLHQVHLNRRRFFHFFTKTHRTGSSCLLPYQIVSNGFDRQNFAQPPKKMHIRANLGQNFLRSLLTPTRPQR